MTHLYKFWCQFSLICIMFLLVASNLYADPDDYLAEAYRTFMKIKVDGAFDEDDWQKARPINKFVQVQPDEGDPSTQLSEVRILYDDKNIYFGYTCRDSEMDKLILNEMRRDSHGLYSNDHGFLLLDTYNDRRNAVFFRFNAIGGVEDAAVSNCGDTRNDSWDIVWECQGKVNKDHWTVEISIPFSQLRFSKSESMTWGINVGRQIAREDEITIWSPVPKSYGPMAKYRTAYFGSLKGLEGISPSRNLEFLPYLLGGVSRIEEEEDKNDLTYDAGLDVKYGITSNLTADVTFNTDFAQVEADEERVNLSRFSLFFPEKRPFFMEGASLFEFGIPRPGFRSPPPLLLFYSRRIGLAEDRAIPILVGGKLTGKTASKFGCYGIGLLNVTTRSYKDEEADEPIDEPTTNYSVLRLKRDVFSGSSIGVMAINKQNSDKYNRSGGLDFAFRPVDSVDIRGLWAQTYDKGTSGSNNAFYLGGNWRNDNFQAGGSYTDIGEFFNPEVGFIRREDIRQIRADAGYEYWLEKFGIQSMEVDTDFDVVYSRDSDLETREVSLGGDLDFEMGGGLGINARHTEDILEEDFEIREDVFIPAGEYSFAEIGARFSTDGNKKLSGRFGGDIGDFYSGNKRGFNVSINFKPNARLSLDSMFNFNQIELPEESFDASIFGSRASYSFSTKLFAKLFAQWNSEADIFSANILVNYIYLPGSDFYLVVNQAYETEDGISHAETTVIAKLTYWWNP